MGATAIAAVTRLVRPAAEHLPEYVSALERGWSPDNLRPARAQERLAHIEEDAADFLGLQDDPEALGGPVTLPDGSRVRRLPGFVRWIWADGFCGSIGLRWRAPGDASLPAHVLGHIGYAVVPWRRGEGHATRALSLLLPEARALPLPWVELATEPDNLASQRVIAANGGRFIERFTTEAAYGGDEKLRFRIAL